MKLSNQTVMPIIIAAILASSTACTPEINETVDTQNKHTTTPGPCVGNICLGSPCVGDICVGTGRYTYLSNCSQAQSVSSVAEIKTCSIQNQHSIAGTSPTSAQIATIDGKAARLILLFDDSSCQLLQSSLEESLGKVIGHRYSYDDDYDRLYNSVGYESRRIQPGQMDMHWVTKNGQFVLRRSSYDGCELKVDSASAAKDLDRKLKSMAKDSISG